MKTLKVADVIINIIFCQHIYTVIFCQHIYPISLLLFSEIKRGFVSAEIFISFLVLAGLNGDMEMTISWSHAQLARFIYLLLSGLIEHLPIQLKRLNTDTAKVYDNLRAKPLIMDFSLYNQTDLCIIEYEWRFDLLWLKWITNTEIGQGKNQNQLFL